MVLLAAEGVVADQVVTTTAAGAVGLAWLIPVVPLLSFLVLVLTSRRLRERAGLVGVAAAGLAVLSPMLLLIGFTVRLTSAGPAIYRQRRVGRDGHIFTMWKFRSMRDGAESETGPVWARENDPRVTPVGRWLRRFSLDELPQLWNVLRGDMSIVGPRPILPCDLDKFPRGHQLRRFTAKPGVTGLWQVSGRSRCSDAERIQLDLVYVDCWSLALDFLILARTVPTVLSGQGAY